VVEFGTDDRRAAATGSVFLTGDRAILGGIRELRPGRDAQ
jgi:hypothetical protein